MSMLKNTLNPSEIMPFCCYIENVQVHTIIKNSLSATDLTLYYPRKSLAFHHVLRVALAQGSQNGHGITRLT